MTVALRAPVATEPITAGPTAMPRSVPVFALALVALGASATVVDNHLTARAAPVDRLAAVAFGLLLIAAEYLVIRFRYRDEVDALNLFDAALAPVLVAFPPLLALVLVAGAQTAVGVLRRNRGLKAAFNVAQWVFAASAGRVVLDLVRPGAIASGHGLAAVLIAMAVVGICNQLAFATVIGLAERQPLRRVLTGFAPVIVPGWVAGWVVNTTFGVVFVLAYQASHHAVFTFFLPLVVLHLAYRGYATARAERARTAGLHRALQALAAPIDPRDAIPHFLAEAGTVFGARAVDLVLVDGAAVMLHRVLDGDAATYSRRLARASGAALAEHLLGRGIAVHVQRGDGDDLAALAAAEGWRDCLAAPLPGGGGVLGVLCVYDHSGLEGQGVGEIGTVETLAREAAATFQKADLVQAILEERRKLSEIVTHASDGILTLAADGTVESWNPELERITGYSAEEMLGRWSIALLRARDAEGNDAALEDWAGAAGDLPAELQVVSRTGDTRWLACSYSPVADADGRHSTLIVVARDTTGARHMEHLQAEVSRLAELEAAQREVVSQLQEAVRPPMPAVRGCELGVCYLPSDPIAPTGGDLYDWQVLPDGDLHLAVVDVLGKGVAATKDALAVTHALRLLAIEGCPLGEMMARAGDLVTAQSPDLVATVLVARYTPARRRLRLAGAGHPPALLVDAAGHTHELFAAGIAIGWPGAGSFEVVERQLAPGDTLVLYTDGLVEAGKDIIAGLDALARAASAGAHLPAGKLARRLVARSLAGAIRRDDSVALVMRTQAAGDGFEHHLTGDAAGVPVARHALAAWLASQALPPDVRDDLVLVASELCTNATIAARGEVVLRAHLADGEVVLEVEDDGNGFAVDARPAYETCPDPDAERGRGLFLANALVDDLSIESDRDGVVVRAAKRYSMIGLAAMGNGVSTAR